MTGFDRLAPYYDRLARLIFGRSIRKVQTHYLDEIPEGAHVLILGGGTGWLLEELPANKRLCVWFVDTSSRMITRAGRRKTKVDTTLHCGGVESLPSGIKFDVVIANFYLDLFSEKTLSANLKVINSFALSHTKWLVADFVSNGIWHRLLLWAMYRFFRVTCRIEAMRLPDWERLLVTNGCTCIRSSNFWGGFMKSTVWSRAASAINRSGIVSI